MRNSLGPLDPDGHGLARLPPAMSDPAATTSARATRMKAAPAVPEGASVGPPDFIGVGVHKAGTTWWWELIVAHPDVDGVPRRKELHLLERLRDGELTEERIAEYYRHFPRAAGHLAGEWTPRYMAMPAIPPLIARVAPRARLLAIIRDPIERYRSGLRQWQDENRRRSERRDERAGKREALMRGFYGRQVQRLVDTVGPEQVLVLQYERCVRQPLAELARTFRFLGLSPFEPEPARVGRRVNATIGEKAALSPDEQQRLVAEYEPEVRHLARLVPDLDLELWPNFAHLARG